MKRHHIILILIMLFAGIFWSIKLGDLPLWSDEAHTAILGNSVLEHGLPTAWDGTNLVSGVQGQDLNSDRVVTWDQPLMFYVTAASIKLFGFTNFAARLPYLLAGLACILLLYLFVESFTKNKNLALLSAGILAFTTLFFLHARQGRYYSLGTMCTLLLFLSYVNFDAKRWAKWLLPISLTLLFYSNLLMFAVTIASLLIYHFIFDFEKSRCRKLFLYSLTALPFVLPWFFFAKLWAKRGPHEGASIASKLLNIFEMMLKFNRAFFPLLVLLVVLILYFRKKLYFDKKYYRFLFTFILFPLLTVPVLLLPGIRYIIYLYPLCAFLTAIITFEIYRKRKKLAIIFLVLIMITKIFSNILIIVPQFAVAAIGFEPSSLKPVLQEKLSLKEEKLDEALHKAGTRIKSTYTKKGLLDNLIKMENIGYLHEITEDYKDPIYGVNDFLKKNAKPGDEVMIMLDAISLMIYAPEFHYTYILDKDELNSAMLEGLPEYIHSYDNVKWFVPRNMQKLKGPFISEDEFIDWVKSKGLEYKKHEIDYNTFHWDGSRPESFSKYAIQHSDREISDNKVVIYEVIR